MSEAAVPKKAILDLEGATCTSCSIAIEHYGNRLHGVSDILVDRRTKTIQLEYDGTADTVDKIIAMVQKIGYNAVLRSSEEKTSDK
ncbi:MAG TPA: heavy metal-associated domain-containing protein [Spirochaetia bacterium]|nr:heavy metal-associated domain-containing protein [Spirochaetia bacterium]